MRKYNVVVIITLMFLLCACAGWQDNMVKGYEGAGVIGKTYYNLAKTNCDNGNFRPERCTQLKKINNDAQKVYVTAGSMLDAAIRVDDAIKREEFLQKYNELMAQVNKITLDFLKILRELKVL